MNLPDPDPFVDEAKWRAAQHHKHITLVKDRTLKTEVKFFGGLAQKHGVRLSALVAHIIGWVRPKLGPDKDGPYAYEYDPREKFGTAIGVSGKQIYRLLKKAKAAKLLDYRRSHRQVQIWVTDPDLFNLTDCDFDYDRDLAKEYGVNGSIIYANIYMWTVHPPDGHPPGYRASPLRFVKKYPWMTEAGVRMDLIRLQRRGLIMWHNENCHFTSHCYLATRTFKAPKDESACDTLRRQLGLNPDKAHLARAASQGRQVRGRRNGSPESGKDSERQYYNLDEE